MDTSIWLCLAFTLTGLWAGLLLTVTTLLHPMFAADGPQEFRADVGRFLPIARSAPTNYVLVLGMVGSVTGALVAQRHDAGSATFVLTAVALALIVVGAVGISRWAAEPNYDTLLALEVGAAPTPEWERARRRYFALNWLRGGFVWTALVCLALATSIVGSGR